MLNDLQVTSRLAPSCCAMQRDARSLVRLTQTVLLPGSVQSNLSAPAGDRRDLQPRAAGVERGDEEDQGGRRLEDGDAAGELRAPESLSAQAVCDGSGADAYGARAGVGGDAVAARAARGVQEALQDAAPRGKLPHEESENRRPWQRSWYLQTPQQRVVNACSSVITLGGRVGGSLAVRTTRLCPEIGELNMFCRYLLREEWWIQ